MFRSSSLPLTGSWVLHVCRMLLHSLFSASDRPQQHGVIIFRKHTTGPDAFFFLFFRFLIPKVLKILLE